MIRLAILVGDPYTKNSMWSTSPHVSVMIQIETRDKVLLKGGGIEIEIGVETRSPQHKAIETKVQDVIRHSHRYKPRLISRSSRRVIGNLDDNGSKIASLNNPVPVDHVEAIESKLKTVEISSNHLLYRIAPAQTDYSKVVIKTILKTCDFDFIRDK